MLKIWSAGKSQLLCFITVQYSPDTHTHTHMMLLSRSSWWCNGGWSGKWRPDSVEESKDKLQPKVYVSNCRFQVCMQRNTMVVMKEMVDTLVTVKTVTTISLEEKKWLEIFFSRVLTAWVTLLWWSSFGLLIFYQVYYYVMLQVYLYLGGLQLGLHCWHCKATPSQSPL